MILCSRAGQDSKTLEILGMTYLIPLFTYCFHNKLKTHFNLYNYFLEEN